MFKFLNIISCKKIFFLILFYLFLNNFVVASNVEELKSKITEKNSEMEAIQKEINEYKNKLTLTSKESGNLKIQITNLENNLAKLRAEIKFSQNRIEAAKLSIEELSFAIGNTEEKMAKNKRAISEILRLMNESDNDSLIEILLANNNLSDFFDNVDNIEKFEKSISFNLKELFDLKNSLEDEKNGVETQKSNFELRTEELKDKQDIQKNIQGEKSELLKETKSKENLYKNILDEKIKKQKELEKEMKNIEEEIRIIIEPDTLPRAGKGILSWPLEENLITQYFGNTPFATKNPQVYGGMGHNGIDLAASVGTSIKSSAEGKVVGTGDTDKACNGASYGKWILIEHPNNLSTLYSHLSLIKAKTGDIVTRGQLIGYTGNTGYTTGPHLHFAVYAAKAVKVSTMQSKVCGTIMTLPIAPFKGYLNPLSYL